MRPLQAGGKITAFKSTNRPEVAFCCPWQLCEANPSLAEVSSSSRGTCCCWGSGVSRKELKSPGPDGHLETYASLPLPGESWRSGSHATWLAAGPCACAIKIPGVITSDTAPNHGSGLGFLTSRVMLLEDGAKIPGRGSSALCGVGACVAWHILGVTGWAGATRSAAL